ncbi:MAG: hypothetical protein HYU97_02260 [Deltaproteobacteria bacterium]|nr:hypothetical protein [Deltaproteobacteria bacterium]
MIKLFYFLFHPSWVFYSAFWVVLLFAMPCWAESPILDRLELDKDFPSGCGCIVGDAKGHFLVASDIEEKSSAIIKIAGKRYELKWVSSTETSAKPRLGARFSNVYESGPIRLELNRKTTFVCSPRDESCEVTGYVVRMILTIEGQTYRWTGLKGECGC